MNQPKNVLIVEDELLIARQLKNCIIRHGYLCSDIALDYRGAIEVLKTKKIDIVLLDIKISGKKTGLDIAKFINEKYKIPFLFITSFNDSDTLLEIKKLNPKGYINKPINEATLITTLDIIFNNIQDEDVVFTTINIGTTTYNIHLSDLIYIEAEHVYVRFHYKSKMSLIRTSLTNILELLPKDSLLKISRGIAINPKFIESASSTNIRVNTEDFKLSKIYENEVKNFLNK